MQTIPEKVLESGGLVIGRSPEADWMIPDPDRVLSKAHCRIDRTERGFMVTDTSTNGVRINDVPVGRGIPGLLSHGDTLLLGDAIIGVEIEAMSAAVAVAEIPGTVAMQALPGEAFLDGPFGFDDKAAAPAVTVIPAAEEAAIQPGQGPLLQDWWDPKAASSKPELPLSADMVAGSALSPPDVAGGNQGVVPVSSGEMGTLLQAAGTVDVKTLIRVVEKAMLALSENERQVFDARLRDFLQEERSRWQ
ncbi:FHA domain-containing protein [Rhizobium sp. LjRoot30]